MCGRRHMLQNAGGEANERRIMGASGETGGLNCTHPSWAGWSGGGTRLRRHGRRRRLGVRMAGGSGAATCGLATLSGSSLCSSPETTRGGLCTAAERAPGAGDARGGVRTGAPRRVGGRARWAAEGGVGAAEEEGVATGWGRVGDIKLSLGRGRSFREGTRAAGGRKVGIPRTHRPDLLLGSGRSGTTRVGGVSTHRQRLRHGASHDACAYLAWAALGPLWRGRCALAQAGGDDSPFGPFAFARKRSPR